MGIGGDHRGTDDKGLAIVGKRGVKVPTLAENEASIAISIRNEVLGVQVVGVGRELRFVDGEGLVIVFQRFV